MCLNRTGGRKGAEGKDSEQGECEKKSSKIVRGIETKNFLAAVNLVPDHNSRSELERRQKTKN